MSSSIPPPAFSSACFLRFHVAVDPERRRGLRGAGGDVGEGWDADDGEEGKQHRGMSSRWMRKHRIQESNCKRRRRRPHGFYEDQKRMPIIRAWIRLACGKTGSRSVMLVSLIEDGHPSSSWFMGLRSVRNPWYASILRPLLRGLDVEGGREVVICRGEGDGGGDLQLLLKGRRRGGAEMRGYCCLFLHAVFLSWFTLKKGFP
ncbi:uncharacterized protein [Triticum aestivum]|uniref:uncharacterized protein isoform X3 n=1 Tax=Triticum aestivum TaxID=4565 RepID=UPI001D01B1CA|nr:uncharacterized protein LOC123092362 isoform X3 [Triticum aestivum]